MHLLFTLSPFMYLSFTSLVLRQRGKVFALAVGLALLAGCEESPTQALNDALAANHDAPLLVNTDEEKQSADAARQLATPKLEFVGIERSGVRVNIDLDQTKGADRIAQLRIERYITSQVLEALATTDIYSIDFTSSFVQKTISQLVVASSFLETVEKGGELSVGNLSPATVYRLSVRNCQKQVKESSCSAFSSYQYFATWPELLDSTPRSLQLTSQLAAVTSRWEATPRADFYRVLRKEYNQVSADYAVIVPNLRALTYTDNQVQPGVTYTYTVQPCQKRLTHASGLERESTCSASVYGNQTIALAPLPQVAVRAEATRTEVEIVITSLGSNALSLYQFQKCTSSAYTGCSVLSTVDEKTLNTQTTEHRYKDSGLTPATTYFYRVRACQGDQASLCTVWSQSQVTTLSGGSLKDLSVYDHKGAVDPNTQESLLPAPTNPATVTRMELNQVTFAAAAPEGTIHKYELFNRSGVRLVSGETAGMQFTITPALSGIDAPYKVVSKLCQTDMPANCSGSTVQYFTFTAEVQIQELTAGIGNESHAQLVYRLSGPNGKSKYQLAWKTFDSANWSSYIDLTADSGVLTEQLPYSKQGYNVRVRACVNEVCTDAKEQQVNGVVNNPGVPQVIKVETKTKGAQGNDEYISLTLAGDPNGGAPIDYFELIGAVADTRTPIEYPATNNAYSLEATNIGQSDQGYMFEVRACRSGKECGPTYHHSFKSAVVGKNQVQAISGQGVVSKQGETIKASQYFTCQYPEYGSPTFGNLTNSKILRGVENSDAVTVIAVGTESVTVRCPQGEDNGKFYAAIVSEFSITATPGQQSVTDLQVSSKGVTTDSSGKKFEDITVEAQGDENTTSFALWINSVNYPNMLGNPGFATNSVPFSSSYTVEVQACTNDGSCGLKKTTNFQSSIKNETHITYAPTSLFVAGNEAIKANCTHGDNPSFSSSSPFVVTIDSLGNVAGIAPGSARINIACPDASDKTVDIQVIPQPRSAYALRKVVSGYVGPAIQVARSTGDGTTDIYFTHTGVLDIEAIKQVSQNRFDVHVLTWYDQMTTGNHARAKSVTHSPVILRMNAGVPEIAKLSTSEGSTAMLWGEGKLFNTFELKGDDVGVFAWMDYGRATWMNLYLVQAKVDPNRSVVRKFRTALYTGNDFLTQFEGKFSNGQVHVLQGRESGPLSQIGVAHFVFNKYIGYMGYHTTTTHQAGNDIWTSTAPTEYIDGELGIQSGGKMSAVYLYNSDVTAWYKSIIDNIKQN